MTVKEILMEPFYFQSRFIPGIQTFPGLGIHRSGVDFLTFYRYHYLYHSAIE